MLVSKQMRAFDKKIFKGLVLIMMDHVHSEQGVHIIQIRQ